MPICIAYTPLVVLVHWIKRVGVYAIVREEKGDPLFSPGCICDGGNLLVKPPERETDCAPTLSVLFNIHQYHGSLPGTFTRLITWYCIQIDYIGIRLYHLECISYPRPINIIS